MKKWLQVSIILFLIAAVVGLFIVLNKGHIGSFSLVKVEKSEENAETEKIMPKLSLEIEDDYLSSKNKKKTGKMVVTIDGEIVTDGVVFESLDEDVVKINDDNELVPVKDGKATIKAMYSGMEATDEIKVITPITSMSFTTTNSTVRIGKDLQMKLKVTPSDASLDTISYKSSDEEIATVNNNGIVTGVSQGKVTITVYDSYTDTEKKVNLTIRK